MHEYVYNYTCICRFKSLKQSKYLRLNWTKETTDISFITKTC